jgi:hypothetical protein
MRTISLKSGLMLLAVFVVLFLDWFQAHGQTVTTTESKPIVAVVQRANGKLTYKIHPDPAPGKDALFAFNTLREKLGPNYPVVAIVEDNARVSDLYDISGIAGKAGFDNIRTFISNKNNGMMFEVKFGPAIPSSVEGPFEPRSNPQKQSN